MEVTITVQHLIWAGSILGGGVLVGLAIFFRKILWAVSPPLTILCIAVGGVWGIHQKKVGDAEKAVARRAQQVDSLAPAYQRLHTMLNKMPRETHMGVVAQFAEDCNEPLVPEDFSTLLDLHQTTGARIAIRKHLVSRVEFGFEKKYP